jgi:hypothetical protein
VPLRYFRYDRARLLALKDNARLIIARPLPAPTAASDRLGTRRRVDGGVLLAMRGGESIAHGLALSHQPDRTEM